MAEEIQKSAEMELLDDALTSNYSEEELSDIIEEDDSKQTMTDPFQCPDDDFLRSVWPAENKGLSALKKYINEGGGKNERTPIVDFGVDKKFFVCPGCKSNLTKGTSFWSTSSFIGNVHVDKKPRLILCKKCVAKYYEKLLEFYNGDVKRSLFHLCYDFDFYYDGYLVDKLILWKFHDGSRGNEPELKFPDAYLKIITSIGKNNPYKGKTLFQQIGYDVFQQVLTGQYDFAARKKEIEDAKQQALEATLSKEDRVHRSKILATYLYDPFENYPVEEKSNLYRSLYMMLDDTIAEDLPRQRAALEIVTSYITLEKLNDKLQELIQTNDNSKDSADNIAKWSSVCATKASIIEKQARENGFSMRYSGAAGKGSGTLSGIQKELNEGYDDDILTNYYDIKTSSSIKHIADISSQSIIEQLELGENDYVDMIKEQRDYIAKLTAENDKMKEELRLIKVKLSKGRLLRELKQEFISKGIDPEEIDMILEDEYTVPAIEGDPANGDE